MFIHAKAEINGKSIDIGVASSFNPEARNGIVWLSHHVEVDLPTAKNLLSELEKAIRQCEESVPPSPPQGKAS